MSTELHIPDRRAAGRRREDRPTDSNKYTYLGVGMLAGAGAVMIVCLFCFCR
jgi:hypothetical protein